MIANLVSKAAGIPHIKAFLYGGLALLIVGLFGMWQWERSDNKELSEKLGQTEVKLETATKSLETIRKRLADATEAAQETQALQQDIEQDFIERSSDVAIALSDEGIAQIVEQQEEEQGRELTEIEVHAVRAAAFNAQFDRTLNSISCVTGTSCVE